MNDDIKRALLLYMGLSETERIIFKNSQREFDSQLNESKRKEIRENFAFPTGPRAGSCPKCGYSG